MSGECFGCGSAICVCDLIAAQRAANEQRQRDLHDALVELQAASWSRSWKRVVAARARVLRLTGLDVTGPLRHEFKRLEDAVAGTADEGKAVPSRKGIS